MTAASRPWGTQLPGFWAVLVACVLTSVSTLFQVLFVDAWPEASSRLRVDVGLLLGVVALYGVLLVLGRWRVGLRNADGGFVVMAMAVWLRNLGSLQYALRYGAAPGDSAAPPTLDDLATAALHVGLVAYAVGAGLVLGTLLAARFQPQSQAHRRPPSSKGR